ncbi:CotD family spore coat protein [Sporolactobacillus sp. THM19-2]|uniref:CotD family spore coat protein n=1 Tax=Sporolactobacillus sp. THM19-2 TaxID=2511171 RepID=UPI00101F38A6|nr:CotD family spore coat protein [Sporolactobacillus sp. THM19-2]RYL93625.1 hypothetical protein EWH91_04035 [Sporolactobacillus sp. THM19-2]
MEVSPYSNQHPMPVNPYAHHENKYPVMKPEMKPVNKPAASPASKGKCGNMPVMSPAGKSPVGGMGMHPGAMSPATGPVTHGKPLHCPPTQGGSFFDPQSVNVTDVYKPVVVRHIHPMHTQIRTHFVYEHQHFYPQSVSHTCDERHFDVQCGKPCFPRPHC